MTKTQWRRYQRQKKANALKEITNVGKREGKQEAVFLMVKRSATERIFPPLPTLEKSCLVENDEMTSNFSGSEPSFDVICVVLVLPIEYDVPSEVSDVDSDSTEEMAIHRPLCYYVMNNGCVEDQHAFFERPMDSMKLHLKPLFIQAKINRVGVNKVLVDGGATVNLLSQSFLKKIGLFDSDLKPHNVILTNYEGTTENSLGAIEVDLVVGSICRTTTFMVVPSKGNFNVLLGREWIHGVGAVPSTLHQRIAIWRKDGLVENIEANQSYFLAEVNNITKKNFDKKLAFIPPVMSLGPKYTVSEDEMNSMKVTPKSDFVWEREFIDQNYIIVGDEETPLKEEDLLRTRSSAYKKVASSSAQKLPSRPISPEGWDVKK